MKLEYLLLTVIAITLSSCFTNLYLGNGTSEFKEGHASIENGMSMDDVVSLMGEPMNRQFRDGRETWQYCEQSSRYQFMNYTVSFNDKLVNEITTYSSSKSHVCPKCENCFREVRFYGNRNNERDINIPLSSDMPLGLEELLAHFNEHKFIVLANFQAGNLNPKFNYTEEAIHYLVEMINDDDLDLFKIVGHTNSQGSEASNMELSMDRANEVERILELDYGLNPQKIETLGWGEGSPIADNSTKKGRAENSRVEVRTAKNFID